MLRVRKTPCSFIIAVAALNTRTFLSAPVSESLNSDGIGREETKALTRLARGLPTRGPKRIWRAESSSRGQSPTWKLGDCKTCWNGHSDFEWDSFDSGRWIGDDTYTGRGSCEWPRACPATIKSARLEQSAGFSTSAFIKHHDFKSGRYRYGGRFGSKCSIVKVVMALSDSDLVLRRGQRLHYGFWDTVCILLEYVKLSYSAARSSTISLRESIFQYVEENGRTYHAYNKGSKCVMWPESYLSLIQTPEYNLPNDDAEQERLDLQHHLFNLTLNGNLHLAPLPPALHNVLDIGTGNVLRVL